MLSTPFIFCNTVIKIINIAGHINNMDTTNITVSNLTNKITEKNNGTKETS